MVKHTGEHEINENYWNAVKSEESYEKVITYSSRTHTQVEIVNVWDELLDMWRLQHYESGSIEFAKTVPKMFGC